MNEALKQEWRRYGVYNFHSFAFITEGYLFKMKYFTAIFLLIASLAGSAQTVIVSKPGKIMNLANVSSYLEDPSGKYTIEDIIKKDA
ncbi:MAG TPA: hypothetical protein VFQ47_07405, partial [Nitrososphaera sp.]|nr:hypothetical protein [Nitrososphaera sp.]